MATNCGPIAFLKSIDLIPMVGSKMLPIPEDTSQDAEELLQIINDGIANIKFRIHQNCQFAEEGHVCESEAECSLYKDCVTFSDLLENNKPLLEMVLSYPFLNQKLVEIFNKLSYRLRQSIASFGDFKAKSEREIEFLSQLEIDPTASVAGSQYDRKGAANYVLGNYEEAIVCFNEAINFLGEKPNILFRRGEAKYKLELYKEADQDFKLAIELNDQASAEDRLEIEELGTANLRLGNFKTAEEDFLKVIEQNPNHADANCRLGEIYSSRIDSVEDLQNALIYFERAIKANENHFEARFEHSLALFRLAKLIGGNTVLQYLESVRAETRDSLKVDQSIAKSVVKYCGKSLDELKWLINKTEENGFILPHAKALRLSKLYLLNGKIFKVLGDNTFSNKETKSTGHIREKVIKDLDSCKEIAALRFDVGEIVHSIVNFKRLSEDNQKLKATVIANQFNRLISKTQKNRIRERRIIISAAVEFYASIGACKTAGQYIQKLQFAEQKDGVRDSVEYTEQLKNELNALKLDLQKSKLNTEALLFYMESQKSYEKAASVLPTSSAYFLVAIGCLCISDFVPKLKDNYLQKASVFIGKGLELDAENEILLNLKSDIERMQAGSQSLSA